MNHVFACLQDLQATQNTMFLLFRELASLARITTFLLKAILVLYIKLAKKLRNEIRCQPYMRLHHRQSATGTDLSTTRVFSLVTATGTAVPASETVSPVT
jgi:hypothetical protein